MLRQHATHAAALLAAFGFFLAGIFADGRVDGEDVRIGCIGIGVAIVVTAVGCVNRRALRQRIMPLDNAFEKGIEIGRTSGYWDGRRSVRPAVVHLTCPHCGEQLRKTG